MEMIELGIDEVTIVLQLSPSIRDNIEPSDWAKFAETIIETFAKQSDFIKVFGSKHIVDKAPSGYTVAYAYGEHRFYLAVAYHEWHLRMGVIVNLSAQALDYYLEMSCLQVHEFLQKVKSDNYTIRLSKIDLTADYVNENINVTTIYQDFIDNKVAVFRENTSKQTGEISYRRSIVQYRGFIVEKEVPTIYIGSPKSNSQLRIYDKRREQIERKGNKFDKAIKCQDWVRFEGVFRNEFAHQISEELQKIKSDAELLNFIASTLSQKFRLMYIDDGVVDCNTVYTQMLIDCVRNNHFVLKAPSSRNFDLTKSIDYILSGSGLTSTLYKIKTIWGEDAVSDILAFIKEYVDDYKPNDDVRYWLGKNARDYKNNHPNFEEFKKDNLATILQRYLV